MKIPNQWAYSFRREKRLLYRVANSILKDPALSAQAAEEGLSACERGRWIPWRFDPILHAAIQARRAAVRLYHQIPNQPPFQMECWTYVKPNEEKPDFERLEELDALMLCLGSDYLDVLLLHNVPLTPQEIAFLLSIPEAQAKTELEHALALLHALLTKQEEGKETTPPSTVACTITVQRIANRIIASFNRNVTSTEKPSAKKAFGIAGLFALLDVAAFLLVFGVAGWCGGFIEAPPPLQLRESFRTNATDLPSPPPLDTGSLFWLGEAGHDWLKTLPEGFFLSSHLHDVGSCKMEYTDGAHGVISFLWQRSSNPVAGFSDQSGAYEAIDLAGYKRAYREQHGLQTVYWYNGANCYTLLTNLSREATFQVVEGVAPPKKPPLEYLPEEYTPSLAKALGDIIPGEVDAASKEVISGFFEDILLGKGSTLRIAEFQKNNAAIITDLTVEDGRVYYTRDEHRDPDSQRPWVDSYTFDRIIWREEKNTKTLLLESDSWESPVFLFSY